MELYGHQFIRESDLTHHGILGQKWGKRNGPPYPLGEPKHSSAEKKAGWKKSLNKTTEKKTDLTQDAKTEKGKKIAKRVLITMGAVAVIGGIVAVASSSGSGIRADIYDPEIMELAKSLENKPFGGKLEKKHWDKYGRLVLPPKEYRIVMSEIKTHKEPRYENKKMYPHYSEYGGGVYIVRRGKFKDPEIIDWFLTTEEAEEIWKELF